MWTLMTSCSQRGQRARSKRRRDATAKVPRVGSSPGVPRNLTCGCRGCGVDSRSDGFAGKARRSTTGLSCLVVARLEQKPSGWDGDKQHGDGIARGVSVEGGSRGVAVGVGCLGIGDDDGSCDATAYDVAALRPCGCRQLNSTRQRLV